MSTQDPNPLPYGALPYYQVHYLVESLNIRDPSLFTARCLLIKEGWLEKKRVIDLQWKGGRLAELLKSDDVLTGMLSQLLLEDGEINVDPQGDRVRIYGKWKREDKLGFDLKFFEVADRIASVIRELAKS
jgi:hypothetical protein